MSFFARGPTGSSYRSLWYKAIEKAVKDSIASADDAEIGLEFSQGVVSRWTKVQFGCAEEYRLAENKPDMYGYFPMLVRKYCGRLLGESFCERVLSVANRVVTKQNTSLSSDEVESTVILRMNSDLIRDMFDGAKTTNEMLRRMSAATAEDTDHQTNSSAAKKLKSVHSTDEVVEPMDESSTQFD
eukprot:m.6604 g.6604  ORF g.6604 m.6604 type:complete len:185 (-) comp3864_c0_seq1:29-583(-)